MGFECNKMAVEKLVAFLRDHKSNGEYNFVSLRGGKYYIGVEDKKQFLELYCNAAPLFTEDNATSLVWRPPKCDHFPLIFDIDLVMAEDIHFENETFIELARLIMYYVTCEIKEGLGVLLTRKQRCYSKTTEDGVVFKTGFHMYVFGVLVSREIAHKIRDSIVNGDLQNFIREHKILNTPNEVGKGCVSF